MSNKFRTSLLQCVQHCLAKIAKTKCMSKVIFYNPSDCWKYFIFQHIFILCSVHISNEKSMSQSMYYLTYPIKRLTFWGIACKHPASSENSVRSKSTVMSINGIIQLKSCFIRGNYIEKKKIGVIISFFIMFYHLLFLWVCKIPYNEQNHLRSTLVSD